MRGEVEIWEGDKLIHKESNLLVNGAGEAIVDMLTVSPSLSGIPSASALLDTSNYTIQAISFGKDASAYQFNAHALTEKRNLAKWSTLSSVDQDAVTSNNTSLLILSSCPEVTNPPGFEDVPSSVAHVVAMVDNSIAANVSIAQTMYMTNPPHAFYPDLNLSAGQDQWFCRSAYVKLQVEGYPNYHPANRKFSTIHWKMQLNGEDKHFGAGTSTGAGIGKSRTSTDPRYDADATEFSSLALGFEGDQRGNSSDPEGGYSIDEWDANGGVIPVGDGWYRIWECALAPVSGLSSIQLVTYPAGHESVVPAGEPSGGIYYFGEQLEIGRWPTDLQINNDYSPTNFNMSGNALNMDSSPGAPADRGTVRVIPPYGTSSYVPTNYLSSPPNPDSTRVEDGDTDLFGSSSVTSGFNMGQNLNVIPYRAQYNQIPGVTFYVDYNYIDEGTSLKALFEAYDSTNYPASGTFSMGPQAYSLGCYPEGSSTGGSTFALVSSLDNSAAYPINYAPSSDPNFVSGTYNSIVNEASSMDVSGFVNMVMSGSPGTTTGYAMSSTASGLCVSGGADSTNSGIVEYSMLLGSGDVGYSNLYGGIYNMGLWTIDTEASRLAGNSPPYSFGPLDNPRKYKLFATKHLTKNLGFIEDNGTAAGAMNYSDLTIKWRIHFT